MVMVKAGSDERVVVDKGVYMYIVLLDATVWTMFVYLAGDVHDSSVANIWEDNCICAFRCPIALTLRFAPKRSAPIMPKLVVKP
jgi:hypothetical protein